MLLVIIIIGQFFPNVGNKFCYNLLLTKLNQAIYHSKNKSQQSNRIFNIQSLAQIPARKTIIRSQTNMYSKALNMLRKALSYCVLILNCNLQIQLNN